MGLGGCQRRYGSSPAAQSGVLGISGRSEPPDADEQMDGTPKGKILFTFTLQKGAQSNWCGDQAVCRKKCPKSGGKRQGWVWLLFIWKTSKKQSLFSWEWMCRLFPDVPWRWELRAGPQPKRSLCAGVRGELACVTFLNATDGQKSKSQSRNSPSFLGV